MAIIGVSGHIGSGKDTVGKIIQYLTLIKFHKFTQGITGFLEYYDDKELKEHFNLGDYEIRKYADKLKEIASLLTGIPRANFEKEEVKNSYLPEMWNYNSIIENSGLERKSRKEGNGKMTVRQFLQELGTDAGRNIIHPNIWVNGLMSDYKPIYGNSIAIEEHSAGDKSAKIVQFDPSNKAHIDLIRGNEIKSGKQILPNWIITDVRFPNEAKAIEERGGIVIKVNRNKQLNINQFTEGVEYEFKENFLDGTVKTKEQYDSSKWLKAIYCKADYPYIERGLTGINAKNDLCGIRLINHPSETALDNHDFQYTLDNNGTIEELVEKVKEILINQKLI